MTDQTETARELLWRHQLPEDVIDGALCLHAQELAAVQRRDAAVWGVDTAAGKHILAAADLIDPTKTAAVVPSAVPAPTAARAGLRAQIATAVDGVFEAWRDGLGDVRPQDALVDAVLPFVPASVDRAAEEAYRLALSTALRLGTGANWEAIRDRAEDLVAEVQQLNQARVRQTDGAASVDRATVLRKAADQIDAETQQLKADGVLELDKFRPCRDASAQLRRLAVEARDGQTTQGEVAPGFTLRVLELFSMSHADAYGDLFWRVDDGQLSLYANVSDVFAWGGSDCEPITPDTLPALEQAYSDLKAIQAEEFTAELYAARQRGARPQGAAYPSGTHESWRQVSALYDACGPERELGLGNPKAAPAHTGPAGGAQQPKEAAPAVPQCDGCAHLVHRARKCPAVRYGERCECDEPLTTDGEARS